MKLSIINISIHQPGLPPYLYTADSPYNKTLDVLFPGGIPIDTNSDTHIMQIINAAADGVPATFFGSDVSQYTVPVYFVDENTPTGSVSYSAIKCEASYSSTMWSTGGGVATGVPRPVNIKPAAGSDAEISLWNQTTGDTWDFWGCGVDGSGYWDYTCTNFSHFSAAGTGDGVPADTPNVYASRGPGVPYMAGLNFEVEADVGVFKHCQATAWDANSIRTTWIYPGVKSDGSAGVGYLPECARLKLRNDFPVADLADPLARAVGTQWQDYGLMIADNAGTAKVFFESDESVGLGDYWGNRVPVDLMHEISVQDFVVIDPDGVSEVREPDLHLLGANSDDPYANTPSVTGTVGATSAATTSLALSSWSPAANEVVAVMVSLKSENGICVTSVTGNGMSFVKIARRIERKVFSQNVVHELWAAPGIGSPTTGQITVNISQSRAIVARAVRFTAGASIRKVFSKDFGCVPQSQTIVTTNTPSVTLRGTTANSLIVSFGTARFSTTWGLGTGQSAISLNDTPGGTTIKQSSFTQAGGGDITCAPTLSGNDEWLYTAFEVT